MLTLSEVDVFHGELQALRAASLEVREGELVALIGANGAGKTTMVNTICGLHRPRRGEIHFRGERLDLQPAYRVVQRGLVQVPEGRQLFPEMTVEENLRMGAYTLPKAQLGERLAYVYDFLPVLRERRRQLAGSMSGGQQQMVAIGRALMSDPKFLILDEPTLGLAPIMVQAVLEKVVDINRQGKTILLIEQNVVHSLSVAHRAYVLENGSVVLSGTGKELLGSPHVREAYLGLTG